MAQGSRQGAWIRSALLALTILAPVQAASCSLLIDVASLQCASDDDCQRRGAAFAGSRCTENHACVVPDCATNQECIDAHGAEWICRHADRKCAPLKNDQCTEVLAGSAEVTNDDTAWLGVLAPLSGPDTNLGISGKDAIALARSEFATTTNGLPPLPGSDRRRPLAFVVCDQANPNEAATHLVDVVKVPAIVGPAFSGVLIKLATELTIPKKVLLISPTATSQYITNLDDDGLVWRTAPSDVVQVVAITLLLSSKIEPELRGPSSVLSPGETLRLAVVHKGEAYGRGLQNALFDSLRFNDGKTAAANGSAYKAIDYGDPSSPDFDKTRYAAAVAEVIAFAPHVIILVGTGESIPEILGPIEERWPTASAFRPRYILTDGGEVPPLFGVVGTRTELRLRVVGTTPGTTSKLYSKFVNAYSASVTDGTVPDSSAAEAYDAAYLLAYAWVATRAAVPTGPMLATGLKKMVPPGAKIDAGQADMPNAFTRLSNGENIDFNGASGPLDFDVTTGEAESDIKIWCVAADPISGKANAFRDSGLAYVAADKKLEGSFFCP